MWRDDRLQTVIDTITGFIVAETAERFGMPVHEVERKFMSSKTYRMLCDRDTGLYADNIRETSDLFLRELK